MPIAPGSRSRRSAREITGSTACGSPLGTSPTTLTPSASRSNAADAAMPRTKTTSAPGSRGAMPRRTPSSARNPIPSAIVGMWVSRSLPASSASSGKKSCSWSFTPKSFSSCVETRISTAPVMYPTSTGFERKSAIMPRRSRAAISMIVPPISAVAADSTAVRAGSPPASGPTALATRRAIVASGPAMTCRELENAAYASMPASAAYSPCAGGRPARLA